MTVTNTVAPVVSGTARQGQTLQTTNGTWTFDLDYLTYTYEWLRCDSGGANCVAINGATSLSYVLQAADVGSTIRSRVTATEHTSTPPSPSTRKGLAYLRYGNGEMPTSHTSDFDSVIGSWNSAASLGLGTNASVQQSIVYMSCCSCKSNAGGSYYYGVGLEEARANGWLLTSSVGAEIANAGYPVSKIGDLGLAAYQQRWCQNVHGLLNSWSVDGIFIDDVLYHYVGLTGGVIPAKYPTQSDWLAAVVSFCQAIYTYFDQQGKFVLYNAGGWYPGGNDDAADLSLALWNAIVDYCHGLNSETWTYHPSWNPKTKLGANWTGAMRLPALTRSKSKTFFTEVGAASSVYDYVLLSMLLETTDGSAAFTPNDPGYSSYDRSSVWHSTMDTVLALGNPTQDRVQNGARWERQFDNGLVWVNPSNGTSGIS